MWWQLLGIVVTILAFATRDQVHLNIGQVEPNLSLSYSSGFFYLDVITTVYESQLIPSNNLKGRAER